MSNDLVSAERPLVSVGFPLYNNAETVKRALRSIQRQTWGLIEIILSDDGSSDSTYAICERIAANDDRIRLYRQEQNLYYQNFGFVLERARGEYFMWAAGDDFWRPQFIEANMKVLLSDPECVCSVSRCLFVKNKRPFAIAKGTYALSDSPEDNIARFLRFPSDNTRMYGVFRRHVLLKAFPRQNFHAYDWALSAATLAHGTHYEVGRILMRRDKTSLEHYNRSVRRDHSNLIFRGFPVLKMTLYMFRVLKVPFSGKIVKSSVLLNYLKHKQYVETEHPGFYERYAFMYSWLERHIIWRL